MKTINDGKYSILNLKLWKYFLKLNVYISDYCTNRPGDYIRVILSTWKQHEQLKEKVWYIPYVYKPSPNKLTEIKENDSKR